jgi:hypothetical protein
MTVGGDEVDQPPHLRRCLQDRDATSEDITDQRGVVGPQQDGRGLNVRGVRAANLRRRQGRTVDVEASCGEGADYSAALAVVKVAARGLVLTTTAMDGSDEISHIEHSSVLKRLPAVTT